MPSNTNNNNILQGDVVQQIKNLLAKKKNKKNEYGREGIRPLRDWRIMVLVTAIGVLAVSIAGFSVYYMVENGTFAKSQSAREQKELKINSELLKKQISDLSDRAVRWNELNQNIEPVRDPAQ